LSPLDAVANKAVDAAIEEDKRNERYEPGSPTGRLFPGVVASPMRSEPGNMWDMRLAAPRDSEEYKQAIAGMPIPLPSKSEQDVLKTLHALAPKNDIED
jgi:hypothetical protein